MTTATKTQELTMAGITYYLEPEGKDILITVKDEALIDGVTLFNKILKGGFSELCSIIEAHELPTWGSFKAEEAKLRAKEQLEWYVGLNWIHAEDLIDE